MPAFSTVIWVGAAVVLGVMQAAPSLGLQCELHGLIAATENMISASAYKLGDMFSPVTDNFFGLEGVAIPHGTFGSHNHVTSIQSFCRYDSPIIAAASGVRSIDAGLSTTRPYWSRPPL